MKNGPQIGPFSSEADGTRTRNHRIDSLVIFGMTRTVCTHMHERSSVWRHTWLTQAVLLRRGCV